MSSSSFMRLCDPRRRHLLFWAVRRVCVVLGVWLVATTGYAQTSGSAAKPWWERITFSGDFRSRYEGFYQGQRTSRHRVRLRLRLGLDAELNDDTHFELRVTSGDPGTPVSTNQTFTEFFLPKPFNLDRAVVTYNPTAAPALTLGAGKFGFPVLRTQMVWDDDLNVEGGYQQVAWQAGSKVAFTLVAIETAVNEVKAAADAFMLAGYGQVTVDIGVHQVELTVANYGFGGVDQVAIGSVEGPLKSINTNLLERDATGSVVGFVSDFNMVDVIGQVTLATARPDYPLRLLADWVTNTRAATEEDTGIWLEAQYGGAARPKSYGVGYTFARVEQEAVLSPFIFSDMPGSNLWLHMLEASYMPLPRLSLDLTLHFTKQLVAPDPAGADPRPPEVLNAWLLRPHVAVRVSF